MKKLIFTITILCLGIFSYAQPVLTRSGSYTYMMPSNQSLEQGKATALERAKLDILEKEYGTVVGVTNTMKKWIANGESESSFLSIGETEVKGEWLSTIGEPEYDIQFIQNQCVIKVTVKGKIREISSAAIDIDVRMLKSVADLSAENDEFRHGDNFFIYFKSPVNGYIAVYQYDSDGTFRVLPYDASGCIQVKGGKEYVLLDQSQSGISLYSESRGKKSSKYHFTCTREMDLCRYYIVFSPNKFSTANDESVNNVFQVRDFEHFQTWLGRTRRQDKEMTIISKDLILKK